MTPSRGLDVSYWQGDIDFNALVRDGYKWIIIREGYGTTADKKFFDYVKGAKAAGLPILGVFHFCYALTAADAVAEAKACIKNLEAAGLPKNIMVSYDFEYDTFDKAAAKGVTLGKAQYLAFTDAFHSYMRSQGYTNLAVYYNYDYYKRYCSEEFLNKYIRWLACYNSNPNQTTPRTPAVPCDIQQYSDAGDYDEDWLYNLDLFERCTAGTVEVKESSKPDVVLDDGELSVDEAIDSVIKMAESQIGYLEKASNKNLDSFTGNAGSNNYTKYWRDIRAWSGDNYQAQPWCAAFVTWTFTKCFGVSNTKKLLKHYPFVYCPTLGSLFAESKTPKVGSIVLFYKNGTYGHTGIVVKVSGSTFTTIEGNTSGASGIIANGGGVCRKTYNTAAYVANGTRFVMPDYSLITSDLISSAPAGDASNAAKAAPSSWQRKGIAHCTGDGVNVRENPSGNVIGVLGKGNQFEVDGTVDGDWTHVYVKGIGVGYIYTDYVDIDSIDAPKVEEPKEEPKTQTENQTENPPENQSKNSTENQTKNPSENQAKEPTADDAFVGVAHCTGEGVRVRKTPGGEIIGTLGKGNQFRVDGKESNGWSHVRVDGIGEGYVYSQYVAIDKTIDSPKAYTPKVSTASQNIPSGLNTKKALFAGEVAASSLYVRSGIGTSYAPIKSYPILKKGNRVDVYDIIKGTDGYEWYYIRINTGNRYVFGFSRGDYIKRL